MPPSGSDNRKRAAMRELFPAPVLPTMPYCKESQRGEGLTGYTKPGRTLTVEDKILKFYYIYCMYSPLGYFLKGEVNT